MNIKIAVVCRMCGKTHVVTCNQENYLAWQNGAYIQEALKELTVDQRELLISQTCGECFDRLFKE